MNINDIDLNLLRLFDMVWRYRHVSEAAQRLGLSQPAASQGLARLRRLLGDALFERSSTGVRPTPLAERLAPTVQAALTMLEQALNDSAVFEPRQSQRRWRLHLSDIGEARFLPDLVRRLAIEGPGMQIEAQPLAHRHIGAALDFTVSMHWSRRFDKEPGLQWLRAEVIKLFCTSPSDASHDFNSSLFE